MWKIEAINKIYKIQQNISYSVDNYNIEELFFALNEKIFFTGIFTHCIIIVTNRNNWEKFISPYFWE